MGGYIYILSNHDRSALYIGVTSDLKRRIAEHRAGKGCTFTSRHQLTQLLYFESFNVIVHAKEREKQLNHWHNEWKWELVRENNPKMIDLTDSLW
jgi:putative endonuclease